VGWYAPGASGEQDGARLLVNRLIGSNKMSGRSFNWWVGGLVCVGGIW